MKFIIAMRPWSLTASLSVVFLVFSICERGKLTYLDYAEIAIAMVSIHLAGNLWNSYCDYENKIDTKEQAGDRTIVDGIVTSNQA